MRLAERGGRAVSTGGRAPGDPGDPARRARPPAAGRSHRTSWASATTSATGLFHAARAELRRLAGDDRLVLLVDDLDLLDDTSVAVLVPLIMSRTVFLVGTVRTGRTPSPRLTVLHRDGHLVRMEIEPLDPDDLGTLLHRALDGPVSETAARRAGAAVGRQPAGADRTRARRPRARRADQRRRGLGPDRAAADDGRARRARRRASRRHRAAGAGAARAARRVRAVRAHRRRAQLRRRRSSSRSRSAASSRS